MNIKRLDAGSQRFTAYRLDMDKRPTHNAYQKNPEDQPQFEGVVFSDGTCVIRWLTAARSTSVWASVEDMLRIHGHPEYGTVIVWHDGPAPQAWFDLLARHYNAASEAEQRFDRILTEPSPL